MSRAERIEKYARNLIPVALGASEVVGAVIASIAAAVAVEMDATEAVQPTDTEGWSDEWETLILIKSTAGVWEARTSRLSVPGGWLIREETFFGDEGEALSTVFIPALPEESVAVAVGEPDPGSGS